MRLIFLEKALRIQLIVQPVELAVVRVHGVDVLRGRDKQPADNQHQRQRNRAGRRLEHIQRHHQGDVDDFKDDHPLFEFGEKRQHG